jgi:hypothetical protein
LKRFVPVMEMALSTRSAAATNPDRFRKGSIIIYFLGDPNDVTKMAAFTKRYEPLVRMQCRGHDPRP